MNEVLVLSKLLPPLGAGTSGIEEESPLCIA